PPAAFPVEPLKPIRGANPVVMLLRESQIGDALLEVAFQARHRSRIPLFELRDEIASALQRGSMGRRIEHLLDEGLHFRLHKRGSFASRLRILCAKHRWRYACGQMRLTAFTRPGAPSITTSTGSDKPRPTRSCRKLSHA